MRLFLMSEVPLHTPPPRNATTDESRAGSSANTLKGLRAFTCQNIAVAVLCVPFLLDKGIETLAPYTFPP